MTNSTSGSVPLKFGAVHDQSCPFLNLLLIAVRVDLYRLSHFTLEVWLLHDSVAQVCSIVGKHVYLLIVTFCRDGSDQNAIG